MISEQKLADLEAKHGADPIWQWFNRASGAYWELARAVASYFPKALARQRSKNPFVGIARLTFLFIAGFAVVPPLYLIVGPLVQICIVLIAIVWSCLAGIFGRHRVSKSIQEIPETSYEEIGRALASSLSSIMIAELAEHRDKWCSPHYSKEAIEIHLAFLAGYLVAVRSR